MSEEPFEDVKAISFLLGTWRGRGSGEWPGADPFEYEEEMTFGEGLAAFEFLTYVQRAWKPGTEEILHREVGFWRAFAGGVVDVSLAHPIGVTEIGEGKVEGSSVRLSSTTVGRASNADQVTALVRRYEVQGDTLTYWLSMATQKVPLTTHLTAKLERLW